MPDAGPFTITEPGTYRVVCTGDGGTITSQPFLVVPSADCDNVQTTCQITSQPSSVSGAVGDTISLGGTASGIVTWQTSGSGAGPWTNTNEPTTITTQNVGQFFRFCCQDDPTVCSDPAQITLLQSGALGDRTIAVADGGTSTEEICAECVADWEVRISDARGQFNTIDPDPGLPEPSDSTWQVVPEAAGLECIFIAVNEFVPDGAAPGDEFFLQIAAVCQGTGVRQEATLTIET